MITTLILALITELPITPLPINPACKDPENAPILCDKAFDLLQEGAACERKYDICTVDLKRATDNLKIRTSSVVTIIKEVDTIPMWAVLGGSIGILGGFILGFILGH